MKQFPTPIVRDRLAGLPSVADWWSRALEAGAQVIVLREFRKLPEGVAEIMLWDGPSPFELVESQLRQLANGPNFLLVACVREQGEHVFIGALREVGELLERDKGTP